VTIDFNIFKQLPFWLVEWYREEAQQGSGVGGPGTKDALLSRVL
jgi:hypothetical protein